MLKTSVIIPFHNRDRFFAECLDSVLAQTLLPSEIIVVDDGSLPAQRRFLNSFLPKIKIVSLDPSQGPAVARNTGCDAAGGDVIAFLDDDDVWMPSKLESQVSYLQSHPDCAAVHTGVRAFYSDGTERVYDKKPSPLAIMDAIEAPPGHVCLSSLAIRATALRAVGGFDPAFRCSEDWELCIRLVSEGYRIDFIPTPLIRFRRTDHERATRRPLVILRYDIALVRKHRDLYERVMGRGGARRQIAARMCEAGSRRGGVLGRAVRICGVALGGAAE
ncbi:MAG: glycosyltransferase family A protein [Bryobacteraceae bacterium]|jgi:glycosyltransferase involved in cell wall biosynthesis